MQTDGAVDHDAIAGFRESMQAAVEQAEREGVPPGQQAAIFAHLAYGQFQRSDRDDDAFLPWVATQREHADETQLLEGFMYAMEQVETDADAETGDELLVRNAAEIPRMDGRIPWDSADDRPPETVLDAYWLCPHCGESMPTLRDLWRLFRTRERCAARRDEHEQGTREWHAYNEGVHEYRQRIIEATNGLDDATRKWAKRVIEAEFSDQSSETQ